jgi:hypothetical protein
MATLQPIITAVLPLVGVMIGAGLQYLFSRSAEVRKQLAALRTEAYTDYLRCVAESAKIGRDANRRGELLSQAADAKARIAIYGSAQVLAALAAFETNSPVIDSPEAAKRFLAVVYAIRQESMGQKAAVNLGCLEMVMFGDRKWNRE